ncbi:PD-(D/E)XK nuclease-like domain-containing protein [Mesorhizobium sp. M1B.F.Ca.ET.045.04.1.1]|uniref:PD-(D/E)XK nuclease-like domain-containing protein n=1 Tax=Mesorhizobium sp. M1B.F.Ca.ET.045.04.1.1 TaxID=2493673 RepID=UPI001675081A|nr:PD-(D/E)XK nuclease-like domain-containing protein [Mesorhizobium sp. M1B.F.Ca.ET.045.04.1.1]
MYQRDKAVSTTGIKRLLSCPLDYWALSALNPNHEFIASKSTSSLRKGSAFHCLLLEPHEFTKRFTVKDGVKQSSAPGFVGGGEYNEMMAAIDAIRAMPNVSQLFTDGEAEVTMVWEDKETGVLCRCRHDYFRRKHGMTVTIRPLPTSASARLTGRL